MELSDSQKLDLFDRLENLLLSNNMVRIGNITKTVRIEYGKVGKEGLSDLVSYDGTIQGLVSALEKLNNLNRTN